MATDDDAANAGVDSRQVVADGMKELMISFAELSATRPEADAGYQTARQAYLILDPANIMPPRPRIDSARSELIHMRDVMLSVPRYDWAVLLTHAIWWHSMFLEA
jgi:hypothetical protein